LRYGSLVDQDWKDQNPEALQAIACQEVPLLPGATHYFVSACLTRNEKHPIGVFLGDILVLVPSARGEDKSIRLGFQDEHGHHIGGIQHLALLNHPEIHERLHEWLSA
jgi:hypothetical protein